MQRNPAPSTNREISSDSVKIEVVPVRTLRPNPRNARTHSKKQVRQIAASMKRFGIINPIIVDGRGEIIAGHARAEAIKLLGLKSAPVVRVKHLSSTELRAYMLADNKLAANAGWDRELLAVELEELQITLPEIGLDLEITGFQPAEVDLLLADMGPSNSDPTDVMPELPRNAITRRGDLWLLGNHRLLCGDARKADDLRRLMGKASAAAMFSDPPYNLRVRSIGGRGRVRHAEFAFASGEMSSAEFRSFLTATLDNAAQFSTDGAVHFVCMDWRHIADLIGVGRGVYTEMLNLVVWNKSNAGQGSLYRSQHELIGVFRVGKVAHRNNVELGRFGRNRSNVWNYPGVNTFGRDRMAHLAMHPTVKPVSLVADALLDCTARGDAVLDPFAGSGTLILAAEKVGRKAYAIEVEPRYVDLAIARWQSATNLEATLAGDGRTFEQVGNARGISAVAARTRQHEPEGLRLIEAGIRAKGGAGTRGRGSRSRRLKISKRGANA